MQQQPAVPTRDRPEPPVLRPPDAEDVAEAAGTDAARNSSSIRVDTGVLEKLMNLVGELVLTRNQLLQYTTLLEDPGLLATSQRLNLITSELQEGVMKARMQTIDNVWSKHVRLVRDLSLQFEKKVRLEMEGRDTELDRTILEAIKDPLTHLVRNAVDHGIEPVEVRRQTGKPEEGRLLLRAFHAGGQVNIEVSDDGGGIDVERVKAKALEKGLLSPEQLPRTSERDLLDLIFLPGFSTAAKVTAVSGRGVGMDVVRTNIQRIGGTIDVQTEPGRGTTFKMKIPLTLAIIPALIVGTGKEQYAIPQVSLLELVRLDGGTDAQVERIHETPVYRLRGKLLPLVYLHRELEVAAATGGTVTNIIVLQADGRQFGLVVDEVTDTEEIVVKPLGRHMKGIPLFAGATLLGDGRVALILDVVGLAQRAHVLAEKQDHHGGTEQTSGLPADLQAAQTGRSTLLLFTGPDEGRMAIPLSLVARLEEFPAESLERSGGRVVVQYRGEILPLVWVQAGVAERRSRRRSAEEISSAPPSPVQVVVHERARGHVGLVVGKIIDIIEEELKLERRTDSRPGVLGSAVVQGKVTEVLDLAAVVDAGLQSTGSGPSRGGSPT